MWEGLEWLPSWSGQEGRKFRVCFAVGEMEMGIFFGSVPFPALFVSGSFQSLLRSCPLIAAVGAVVFCGMVGCLGSVLLLKATIGLPPLVSWLAELWLVLILLTVLVSGIRPNSVMRMMVLWT